MVLKHFSSGFSIRVYGIFVGDLNVKGRDLGNVIDRIAKINQDTMALLALYFHLSFSYLYFLDFDVVKRESGTTNQN